MGLNAFTYSVWLIAPLALGTVVAKLHKVVALGVGPLEALGALCPDLGLMSLLCLLSWALLRHPGRTRTVSRPFIHLVVFVATLLVFVEHGFWITTGTLLDPAVLGYGLSHFDTLGEVYLSAMGPLVWLGFAALIAVHLLPVMARNSARKTTRLMWMSWAMVFVATALASFLSTPSTTALGNNVVIAHLGEVFATRAAMAHGRTTHEARPLVVGSSPRGDTSHPHQNVIIIMMESVRASATTPYDPSLETTPFLARLAQRGALVENTWTTMTHTSKALVSALCGVYPMLDLPVVEAETPGIPTDCLARVLGERGYATAFMQPATGGFEQRRQLTENMAYETFVSRETLDARGHEETNYFGLEDEALLEPALAFVTANQAAKRPFFLTLLNLSTHHTYDTPSDFERNHQRHGDYGKYLDAIRYFDGFLEHLFAELEKTGALDHTLVILAGDHGEAFGEHGSLQHNAAIHEEGLHVPLVVFGPGIQPGTRITGLRQLIDLVPTVLEWLGTPVVSGLPGLSLFSTDGHQALMASCWLRRECMATRDDRWKLIWNFDRRPPELYDLTTDPLELNDVFADTPVSIWGPMKTRLIAWEAENLAGWTHFRESGPRDFVSDERPAVGSARDVVFTQRDGRPMVRLIGIDTPGAPVRSGAPIALTFHWEVLSEMPGWYPFTYLLGRTKGTTRVFDGNHPVAQGRHPVKRWKAGTYVSDRFELLPQPGLTPGVYEIALGFFDASQSGVMARSRPLLQTGNPRRVKLDNERRALVGTIEIGPFRSP